MHKKLVKPAVPIPDLVNRYSSDTLPIIFNEVADMVRGRKTNLVVDLTPEERHTLESWQRSTTIRAGLARRGRIILLMAEGASISHVSRTVGIRRRFIYKWVDRFQDQGVTGLTDKPGRGQNNHLQREQPSGIPALV